MNTPANDPTLYEWMVNPAKRLDGKVELKELDSRATLKNIKFYNAFCVDMVLRFDGTANASSFKTIIRISPEQVEIGGLMHDNLWPDESPIGYVPDEQAPLQSGLYSPAAYIVAGNAGEETTDEGEPKKKKKPKRGLLPGSGGGIIWENPPPLELPPVGTPAPPTKVPRKFPIGGLVRQVLQWAVSRFGAALGTIGLTVLLIFIPTNAGPADEWERTLPEEDENRYRELEAKRSEALARGDKLPPQEEADWQALEKRKFPYGHGGSAPKKRNRANEVGDERERVVAEITGGTLAKDEKGNDIKLKVDNVGSTGLDVLGPNGEYIQVGGPAKAKDLADFGNKLSILRKAAERDGVEAHIYLEEGTSPEVIRLAEKKLGKDNVHIFNVSK